MKYFDKHKKTILSFLFVFLVLIFLYFIFNPFVSHYTLELGTQLDVQELLKSDVKNVSIYKNIENKLGKHKVMVMHGFIPYFVEINVEDTIAPKAEITKKDLWIGDLIKAEMFVENIQDASNVKVYFLNDPITDKVGTQNITIVLEDESNNKTIYPTQLTLKKDNEAPKISIVPTILSNLGETIRYKKYVEVTDNRDEDIELNIDSSEVNYNKAGTYNVTYSAIDQSGNKAIEKIKVIILNQSDIKIKEEAIQLTENLINQIAKDKKTKQDKLEVCFDYIRENIVYNGQHVGDKDNYYKDALNGLKTWKGDCLVSNGILRVVCECLDIPTIVVERNSKTRSDHYWFLANTGDGWYHYDAYNQYHRIYRWTDEHLLTWSKQNNHYQDFDQSKYPSTPDK